MKRAFLAIAATLGLSGCGNFVLPPPHPLVTYQQPAPPPMTPEERQQQARRQLANIRASQDMYNCEDQYQYSMDQMGPLSLEHEAQPKIYPSVSDYMRLVHNQYMLCIQRVYKEARSAD